MKAGAFTPAILAGGFAVGPVDVHRSMKAGAFTPAIPFGMRAGLMPSEPLNEGGGFHPRNPSVIPLARLRRRRSMKAGAFTPAIHVSLESYDSLTVIAQ